MTDPVASTELTDIVIRENQVRVLLHQLGESFDDSFLLPFVYEGLEVHVPKRRLHPGTFELLTRRLEDHKNFADIMNAFSEEYGNHIKHHRLDETVEENLIDDIYSFSFPLLNQLKFLKHKYCLEKDYLFEGLVIRVDPRPGVLDQFENDFRHHLLRRITHPEESKDSLYKYQQFCESHERSEVWGRAYESVANFLQLNLLSKSCIEGEAKIIGFDAPKKQRNRLAPLMIQYKSNPKSLCEAEANISDLRLIERLVQQKHITSINAEDIYSAKLANHYKKKEYQELKREYERDVLHEAKKFHK
ncbi:MAG: hypothetical protein KC535_05345 [Nanoarchaeota archaeon]|nr:hypothetical protein [Nanoarchaeota archaeon]